MKIIAHGTLLNVSRDRTGYGAAGNDASGTAHYKLCSTGPTVIKFRGFSQQS